MYACKHPVICYPSNKLTIIILLLSLSSGGDWALMNQDQSFNCDQISAGGWNQLKRFSTHMDNDYLTILWDFNGGYWPRHLYTIIHVAWASLECGSWVSRANIPREIAGQCPIARYKPSSSYTAPLSPHAILWGSHIKF